jgi:hypothetical protein
MVQILTEYLRIWELVDGFHLQPDLDSDKWSLTQSH